MTQAPRRPVSVRRGFVVLAALALLCVVLAAGARPAHAANFTVNSTGDDGDQNTTNGVCDTGVLIFPTGEPVCTLRAAIQQANATTGADKVHFNIPGTGTKTISPSSELPTITDPVTIDGYSQPDTKANTEAVGNNAVLKIELNGENAGGNGLVFVKTANSSTVRGLVVNRFGLAGINLGDASNITVEGNFIGTDATGTVALGNGFGSTGWPGVYIAGRNNFVGDLAPAARNLISGNYEGVGIDRGYNSNPVPDQNFVKGNYIGTDRSGSAKLGNRLAGVAVRGSLYNHVARNVISGNKGNGVEAHAAHTLGNGGGTYVVGNYIGLKSDGIGALGNAGDGVFLTSRFNSVGELDAPMPNTIAFNGGDGVGIEFRSPTSNHNPTLWSTAENRVSENWIFSNGELGIDLGNDGVTPNDEDDPDTGANNLQNYPLLSSARYSKKKGTTVAGTLNSTPDTTFTLQFFSGPSGDEEGKRYLGSKSVTTDSGGDASFVFKTKKKAGGEVTATATDEATYNTSEFSAPKKVVRR